MQLSRVVATSAVIGVLALAGCAAPQPDADKTPEPPSYDYDLIDMSSIGAATPAGTALSFRDVAWLPIATDAGDVLNGFTVLDVVEHDSSFMAETVINPEEFAQYTPYVIFVEQHVDGDVTRGIPQVPLYPMLADGTPGAYVQSPLDAASGGCGAEIPPYDGSNTKMYCIIGLAAEGQQVVGLLYNNTTSLDVWADPENLYQSAPVTWTAPTSQHP
ncbi:hypothetical protein DC31_03755 [Microbacterium sp. CH12i]|uniref:hypothetical protein n=1 Tax=Microbacterium sp. CH12i TaxID=1479651 RepID=UPI000461DA88|nr:hypothetical protein [Microbacterium sp. CH12i]KDA05257.1 hypothetical protein DC31_03755 [Microbacterium sp. CH12i]